MPSNEKAEPSSSGQKTVVRSLPSSKSTSTRVSNPTKKLTGKSSTSSIGGNVKPVISSSKRSSRTQKPASQIKRKNQQQSRLSSSSEIENLLPKTIINPLRRVPSDGSSNFSYTKKATSSTRKTSMIMILKKSCNFLSGGFENSTYL